LDDRLSTQFLHEVADTGSPNDVALPYLFRHAFATWLADSGNASGAIQQLLGHSTLTMTLRYAKATDKQKNKAIESLPSDLISEEGDTEA